MIQIKEINVPKFTSIDFDTTIRNEFFSFLNNFEIVGKIAKYFKTKEIQNTLRRNLDSTIKSLTQLAKNEINEFTKIISENIDSIREESFKVLYCNSRFVESQLLLIKDLKIDLNKEITKNDIYEYITGKVKTETE